MANGSLLARCTWSSSHPLKVSGIHGQNFLNTPDGRKSWATWLLDQGYTVYLLDQVSRGRSPYHPSNGPTIKYTAELVEMLEKWIDTIQ